MPEPTTDTGIAVAGDALELLDAALGLLEVLMDDDHADEYRLLDSRHDAVVKRYQVVRGPR